MAISESGSCCSFSLIMAVVWSGLRIPVAFSRWSRVDADSFRTRYTPIVYARPYSHTQVTEMWLETVGESRHMETMLIGRLGRLGSTPGLLVGMGLGSGHTLELILTHMLGG